MRKLLSFICVLCVALNTYAQQKNIDAEINQLMQKMQAVGLSVAVIKNNKLIYSNAWGKKDIEKNTELGTTDVFRIASISKSFSATAIMQLVEAKKLSLDDDFGKLIGFRIRNPKFPDKVITLRMVLSHTSSLNDSEGYFNLDAINPDKNPNWAKCYSNNEPGSTYDYCNLNFNMTGAVIEKITGLRFDNYIRKHILEPINFYGNYCVDSLDSSRFATLYEHNASKNTFEASPAAYAPRREELSKYVLGYSTPILSPTGGMKTTAIDLAKYMQMHMNYGKANGKRIISKKSAKTMQTGIANNGKYGLALTSTDIIEGKTLKGHTGSAYGLYSAMFFDPEEKFGFVAITNGCNASYANQNSELVLGECLKILYRNLIQK